MKNDKNLISFADTDKFKWHIMRILFFSLFCAYALFIVLGTSDYDILLEKPIEIPGLPIPLPLRFFYIICPLVILILHIGILWMHRHFQQRELQQASSTKTTEATPSPVSDAVNIAKKRWIQISIDFLVYCFPLCVLIAFFIRFTDYQNIFISSWHAVYVWLDLLLIAFLIPYSLKKWLTLLVFIYPFFIIIILSVYSYLLNNPSSLLKIKERPKILSYFPRLEVMHATVNVNSNFSKAKAYQNQEDKQDEKTYKVNLRNRKLVLADFSHSKMVNFDFRDAELIGSNLQGSQLQHSSFFNTNLQGAYLAEANLGETDLSLANLQKANLTSVNLHNAKLAECNLQCGDLSWANLYDAYLVGANLKNANLLKANLKDANLSGANLQGATLSGTNLQDIDNLSWANLQDAHLVGVNLKDVYLLGADLQGANLSWSNLQGSYLSGANLQGANLSWTRLQGAYLVKADLQFANLLRTNLQNAHLSKANLQCVRLTEADLQGADLSWSNLQGSYLSGANLQGANLSWTRLQGACLEKTNLQGANLSGSKLQGANLLKANLLGSSLSVADLQGAYLVGAELQVANLSGARLQGAYLVGADLQGAYLGWAELQGADLSLVNLQGAYLYKAKFNGIYSGAEKKPFVALIGRKAEFNGLGRKKFSEEDFEKLKGVIQSYGFSPNNIDIDNRINLLAKAIGTTSIEWLNIQKGKYSDGVLTWEEACKIQQEVTFPKARERMGLDKINWEKKCAP